MRIDEHMMAGFVAGELTEAERAGVTAALLQDRGLRELLHLTAEALSVADKKDDGLLSRLLPTMDASRPGIRREDRRAMPSENQVRRAG